MTMPGMRPIPDPEAEMHRLAAERKISPRVRKILDEAITVVKPGETLIVRLTPANWTPMQFREYQEALDRILEYRQMPFAAVAILADEIGVAEPR